MEKKQALLLLALALVVALTSFTLGVMVGRRGAERDLVLKQQASDKILVAPAATAPAAPRQATGQPAAGQPQTETRLSFYDDLNKAGTAPLGSGINLPPAAPKPAAPKPAAAPAGKPTPERAEQPIVEQAAAPAPVMPPADPRGKFVVQVGSFAAAGDAGKLKQRLLDKSYPVFVVEADLGQKGLWYRVRLGPYADGDAAKVAQLLLEKQEQIKGFVTRR
jgi:cell division septation protein DedD